MDAGKDAERKDRKGRTALRLASGAGHTAVAQLLLEKGKARVDEGDANRVTSLCAASGSGHVLVVSVLLQAKADPDKADRWGGTPLMRATNHGRMDAAKVLVNMGANPDLKDQHGWTPLMSAAVNGHLGFINMLIEQAQADVHLAHSNSFTALDWALKYRQLPAATLLITHGAKHTPNLKASLFLTPEREAIARGQVQRADVAQYQQHRRGRVLDLLKTQSSLPPGVCELVVECDEDRVQVSLALLELRWLA